MDTKEFVVFIFLGFSFLAQSTYCFNQTCSSEDLRALDGFMKDLERRIDGWDNFFDCCSWKGVVCESFTSVMEDTNISSTSRVVSIELGSRRLQELFQLENLEILDLSSNDFSGFLPMEVNLPSIRFLDISRNSLLGSINGNICATAKQLQVLILSSNCYYGEIPAGLGNCSFLEHLSLSSNFLQGNFPEELFSLAKLSELDLQDNMLSGPLSPSFGNLSNLVKMDISLNRFSGTLPDVFQNLRKLKQFSAMTNGFRGHLPASLTNSPSISSLRLNNNSLTGPIVLNCSAMVCLTSLGLSFNQFNGPIPDNLPSCQQLSTVKLSLNKFGSHLPDSFKNFKSLSHLTLYRTGLRNLSAALSILQYCKNLTTLVLTSNFHNEAMPADFNLKFRNLMTLVIANCGLSGIVPTWLSGCTKLQVLDLSWNHLSGQIPVWFGKLNFLFYLDLSNNSLSGDIPKSMTKLQSLICRNFSVENPSEELMFFIKKNPTLRGLQYNQIWSFPPTLDLSNNMLTGQIWPEFGNLKLLHVFNLNNNYLAGLIPTTLSEMTNLETLDLSYNSLSGSIPPSLVYLTFLSKFSVGYNQLSGRIPSGGQFLTFPDSSFEGNKGLCISLSSSCSAGSPKGTPFDSPEAAKDSIIGLPFGFGAVVGFAITVSIGFMSGWLIPKAETRNCRRPIRQRRHQALVRQR
ncbi:hypothetical protein F0562_034457 [Nyssa sinensis]|uniref:Uncharacterized protein n=1 Tax=Nyssa sinensis TaxID=561372 RepID=A0A5J5AIA2_9ASTE|nr:hypothetical protein F0562_034457 [Nyssa sinensis]